MTAPIFSGHEIWLESTRSHFHKGELARLSGFTEIELVKGVNVVCEVCGRDGKDCGSLW